jgi:molybdenum cofactor synthesis domain-containing protein
MRAAIITISTSKAAGEGEDESGPRLAALAVELGAEVVGADLIPDERAMIEARLRHWAQGERCALVLTTGGTGLAPSDVTPGARRRVWLEPRDQLPGQPAEHRADGCGDSGRAPARACAARGRDAIALRRLSPAASG